MCNSWQHYSSSLLVLLCWIFPLKANNVCGGIILKMAFQIQAKPQLKSNSNYNCPKCGYKYKSLSSCPSNRDAEIIQIIAQSNCGYSYKESWEIPMWKSYVRRSWVNFLSRAKKLFIIFLCIILVTQRCLLVGGDRQFPHKPLTSVFDF